MPTFETTDGINLYYSDEGEGLPILCLSGLTRDGRDFEYVLPHLAGNRVIRLDYRGRGKSDHSDPSTYTIPREGQDALELMSQLQLPQVAILGTSRGGLIAMGLAAVVPEKFLGFALNDIGPELASDGLEDIMDYLGKRPRYKTLEEAAKARPDVMPGFANVPMSRWHEEAAKFFVETPEGLDITYDACLRDSVAQLQAQPTPDLWGYYDAMAGKPLAIIRGANSRLLSENTYDEMVRRRPDAFAVNVPDRGHVPFLDEPESVKVLSDWIGAMS